MRLRRRPGISLLEVLLSMAILLFSITAIARLIQLGSERARDVDDQSIGTTLCQRLFSEMAIGTVGLSNSAYQPFGDDGWDGWDIVRAKMPESEIGDLIVEVRSATAGAGTFTFKFDHMAELTGRTADQIVAARRAAE